MNSVEFKYEMQKYGDTQFTLAEAMGISRVRLNAKINEKSGAVFNQIEIKFIKDRYRLSAQRVEEIFFNNNVSKKDTRDIEKIG